MTRRPFFERRGDGVHDGPDPWPDAVDAAPTLTPSVHAAHRRRSLARGRSKHRRDAQVCKPLGLSVRGTGGEHTPIGADGTVDISPSKRLFIKERDIIAKLYSGISDLMVEEKKAPRRWR